MRARSPFPRLGREMASAGMLKLGPGDRHRGRTLTSLLVQICERCSHFGLTALYDVVEKLSRHGVSSMQYLRATGTVLLIGRTIRTCTCHRSGIDYTVKG